MSNKLQEKVNVIYLWKKLFGRNFYTFLKRLLYSSVATKKRRVLLCGAFKKKNVFNRKNIICTNDHKVCDDHPS